MPSAGSAGGSIGGMVRLPVVPIDADSIEVIEKSRTQGLMPAVAAVEQTKEIATKDPAELRKLLTQHPNLAVALLNMEASIGMEAPKARVVANAIAAKANAHNAAAAPRRGFGS